MIYFKTRSPIPQNIGIVLNEVLHLLRCAVLYMHIPLQLRFDIPETITIQHKSHSQVLTTWKFSTIHDIVPWIGENYTLERSSNSFPGTTSMSGSLENCQKLIPKSWCFPIQGTISHFLLNYFIVYFSPIQGTILWLMLKFHIARVGECNISLFKF